MRSLVLVFAITLFSQPMAVAQKQAQDALSKSLDSISDAIESIQPDSIILPTLEKFRNKASSNQLNYEYANSYLLEFDHYFYNGQWEAAIKAAETALILGKDLPDLKQKTEVQVNALNCIGYVYSYEGDFSEALNMRLKALEIADNGVCTRKDMGNLLSWIADDYRHLYQYAKAVEYLEKCRSYLSSMDHESVVDFYYTYCQSLVGLDQQVQARNMLAELDNFISTEDSLTDNEKNVGYLQSTKLHGEFNLADGNYQDAVSDYKHYLHYSELMENEVHIAIALNKIANTYLKMGNNDEALDYYKRSYQKCLEDGSVDYAFKNANSIADIYAQKHEFDSAFNYSKMAFQLKDSLNASERVKELNFLEAKYQAKKKTQEIAELQLKNTQHELDAVKRDRLIFIGGIVFIAIVVILGLLYKTSRQKRILVEKEKRTLEQQQQVISLQAMVNGQEAERTRIAKDLHDSMGGTFSTIKMYLSSLEHQITNKEQQALLEKSNKAISHAASDMRRIAHNMMPEVLIKLGLIKAIQELVDNINSSKQLKIIFQHFGMEERLSGSFEIMLYRIVQELLNNIMKHSDATEAVIQFIKEENRLHVTIEDNGKGFQVLPEKKGVGLNSVKERVLYLNGKLSIDSEVSTGTTVTMEFLLANA